MISSNHKPSIIWWGKSDLQYSRNRICRQALEALGYHITDFRPWLSWTVSWQARMQRLGEPDLVWVPCFRQRDIASAKTWARKHQVPLLLDPLISAWDKQVFERRKFAPESAQAERLKAWESALLQSADLVLADTPLHAERFAGTLGVRRDRLFTVYVGAEESQFRPLPPAPSTGKIEVLFYGSFIGLHGVMTIVEAAKATRDQPQILWTLLGDGPEKSRCMALAEGCDNIRFEEAIAYSELPKRIAKANILLGVFGGSAKAGSVIPNKVFQALACGKPIISRHSLAYPDAHTQAGLALIPPNDAQALRHAVLAWVSSPFPLLARGMAARDYYDAHFSQSIIQGQIAHALQTLGIPIPANCDIRPKIVSGTYSPK